MPYCVDAGVGYRRAVANRGGATVVTSIFTSRAAPNNCGIASRTVLPLTDEH